MGGLGNVDSDTGQYSNGLERAWSGFTGKHPPSDPRLPQGFGWLPQMLKELSGQAMGNLSFDPSNAASAAGMLGTGGAAGIAGGLDISGINRTFNSALGGLSEGASTGFMPSVADIDALLRPGLERSFERGAAGIRENNALTGNLTSTGASQQVADFRGGLEANLNNNVAGIYGNLLPQSMGIRSDLTKYGTSVPSMVSSGVFNPLASLGLQGQQVPLQALGLATGAIGGAPFFANQGSSGNGTVPALISMFANGGMGGKGGSGGGATA